MFDKLWLGCKKKPKQTLTAQQQLPMMHHHDEARCSSMPKDA
jgi:hypothetical protein